MSRLRPCIYCNTPFPYLDGDGDHVVPQSFGQFEGEFIFRGVCPSCNNLVSPGEEQLARCGPESLVLRQLKPPRLRRNRCRGGKKGAHGAPAPTLHISHGTHSEQVVLHPELTNTTTHIDQLVLVTAGGEERVIPLHPKVTLASLRKAVAPSKPEDIKVASLHCEEKNWDIFWPLLQQLWPKGEFIEGAPREPGSQRTLVRSGFRVTNEYFRAIVKIAFHYYLLNSRRAVIGSEPEFGAVRDIVHKGSDPHGLFRSRDPIRSPFRKLGLGAALPNRPCHLLAMDDSGPNVQAMVQLCVSPHYLTPCYSLELGRAPHGRILVPGSTSAHAYIYGLSKKPYHAGAVKEMGLVNGRATLLELP